MVNKAIRQKNVSGRGVLVQPIDQRIIPICYLTPPSIVNRKEINDAPRDD